MSDHEDKYSISNEMPIGFGLSLAADEKAMSAFANMSDVQKQAAIDQSRQQHSKQDMEAYVHEIGEISRM